MDIFFKGQVSRQLPGPAFPDGTPQMPRLGRYGEQEVENLINSHHRLADEGSYYITQSPTPGTGIAYALTTAFSDTAGCFLAFKNNAAANDPNAKRVYLDYVKLICTVAPTSATAAHCVVKIDNTNRNPTGGTALTPGGSSMDNSAGSVAQISAGALTLGAVGSSARQVGREVLRTVIAVVGDAFVLKFGNIEAPPGQVINGANPTRFSYNFGPVIIGAQSFALVHLWFPANATTPPSFEVETGHWER